MTPVARHARRAPAAPHVRPRRRRLAARAQDERVGRPGDAAAERANPRHPRALGLGREDEEVVERERARGTDQAPIVLEALVEPVLDLDRLHLVERQQDVLLLGEPLIERRRRHRRVVSTRRGEEIADARDRVQVRRHVA